MLAPFCSTNSNEVNIIGTDWAFCSIGAGQNNYTGDLETDRLCIVTFYQTLVKSRGKFIAMLLTEVPRQPELREVAQVPLAIVDRITAVNAFVSPAGPFFLDEIIQFMQPDMKAPSITFDNMLTGS